jgi:hypothetical protein
VNAEPDGIHKTITIKVNPELSNGQQLTALNSSSHSAAPQLDGARGRGRA